MAAPNELSHQLEQKFWHSKAARPLVRMKRGVTYPLRHPVKTATSPARGALWAARNPLKVATSPARALGAATDAVKHPKRSLGLAPDPTTGKTKGPFAELPEPKDEGYPNNRHPWIPN
jgi:hypothetical protein